MQWFVFLLGQSGLSGTTVRTGIPTKLRYTSHALSYLMLSIRSVWGKHGTVLPIPKSHFRCSLIKLHWQASGKTLIDMFHVKEHLFWMKGWDTNHLCNGYQLKAYYFIFHNAGHWHLWIQTGWEHCMNASSFISCVCLWELHAVLGVTNVLLSLESKKGSCMMPQRGYCWSSNTSEMDESLET